MENPLSKLMEQNLQKVWNEVNAEQRLSAIEEIYEEDAILSHVGHQVKGHQAINDAVTATLKSLPATFIFTRITPVVINNDLGRLVWGAGPAGQPPIAKGMDVARFSDGKITALYVFLD